MKILLDTNVWRYIADSGRQSSLNHAARKGGFQITVCPAIVNETLRISDRTLRNKVVELQTRRCWHRLMPDSYLEFEDIKKEINRTHPEWKLETPDHNQFKKLSYHWARISGGWWSHVRKNIDQFSEKMRPFDEMALSKVREQSRDFRAQVISNKKPMVGNWLTAIQGSWVIDGKTVRFDAWRVYAYTIWKNMFQDDLTTRHWMGCHIDIDKMLHQNPKDFFNFWHCEVQETVIPREWLRAAIFALQGDRKVTDGNPLDATIGVHMVDVDLIVSADKNFASIIKRCHDEAPFLTADSLLIEAGNIGVDQLFNFLSDGARQQYSN